MVKATNVGRTATAGHEKLENHSPMSRSGPNPGNDRLQRRSTARGGSDVLYGRNDGTRRVNNDGEVMMNWIESLYELDKEELIHLIDSLDSESAAKEKIVRNREFQRKVKPGGCPECRTIARKLGLEN